MGLNKIAVQIETDLSNMTTYVIVILNDKRYKVQLDSLQKFLEDEKLKNVY